MPRSQNKPQKAKREKAPAAEEKQGSGMVWALSGVVAVLACAVVLLNADLIVPSSGPKAGLSSQPTSAAQVDGHEDCVAERRKANIHFRAGRIQHGLEELMKCAKNNPGSALAHWDVGVQLSKLKDYDNALSWMEQAVTLNTTNAKYASGSGLVATRAGRWAVAKGYYEKCMEIVLRLNKGSWASTLLNSVSDHEADMVWIVDESPEALSRLQSLLFVYLKLQENVNANAAFKILTKLQPKRHDLHRQYAEFLAGQGLLLDSSAVLLSDLREVITEKYDVSADSWGFANLHGLLYLAGGLDSNFVNLGRNLLLTMDDTSLTTIRTNCKLTPELNVHASITEVEAVHLRGILAKCLDEQGVVARLLDMGASTDIKNGFNYQLIHYAAMFGSATFLKSVIDAKPLLDAVTSLGHTAVHLAAIRGHVHLLPQLYIAGVPKEATDRRGRTVLDIACLHRYTANNVTQQFGKLASEVCSSDQLTPTSAPLFSQPLAPVGWKKPSGKASPPMCDFDVRTELSAEDFLFDYLALQRPVLIRGSTSERRWDRLREAWSKKQLVKLYGDTLLRVNPIPYAEAFGLNTTEISLREFVKYMERIRKRGPPNLKHTPDYAFESLEPHHPLTQNMQLPTALNPTETEIIPQTVQFYLGPAGSGAPVHIHRSAYNVQVAGRKRWALLPPPFARYSKEPVGRFFSSEISKLQNSGAVVYECIQEAGDTLFVPGTWGHATLNLEESIGFASEFVWGGDEFSLSEELLESDELGPAAESVGHGLTEEDEQPRRE